ANPEFLKEGAAVEDFMKPDRVIVGVDSPEAADVMAQLYAPFVRTGNPIIFMDLSSAEMTKYAANAMLATRISFMNQIALLCDAVGADVTLVRKGIGTDRRIGPAFLFPGPGYGGSGFPKDLKDRVAYAKSVYDAVDGAAALAIVTEWLEYRNPDFERIKRAMTRPVVVDGRNLYDPQRMARLGFIYESIGRPVACASS